jgi:methyl-accepting chemotaxis protein
VTKTGSRIFKNICILYALCILFLIITITLLSFFYQKQLYERGIESDVKDSARYLASLLEGDLLNGVQSPQDYNQEIYNRLQRMVIAYQKESRLPVESIKVLRRKGDVTSIVLSSHIENDVGREYNLLHEMNPVFNSGSVEYKSPYMNGPILMMSGFAPVRTLSGNIVGILQIDIHAEKIYPPLSSYLYIPALAGIIVLLLGLIVIRFVFRPIQSSLSGLLTYIKKDLLATEGKKNKIETLGYFEEVVQELKLIQEELAKRQLHAEDKAQLQRQIKELMQVVNAAADGDFTSNATITADVLGVLADSFNLMIADLSAIIKGVKQSADHLTSFAKDALDTTKALVQGADKQAAEIETITTAIHNMSNISKDTDQSAQNSAESAQVTKNVAEHGSKILGGAIKGMHNIKDTVHNAVTQVNILNDSSSRIGEITKFIGDISSRTDLLALNATIEAARAGTAGRGFSIVAEEVRNLAERAKRASVEISSLVDEIQTGTAHVVKVMDEGNREVSEGTKLVDEAEAALREILGSVNISATSAREITEATKRQLDSSEEVVLSIDKVEKVVRQTTEGAKKTEIEIIKLEKMVDSLNNAVAKFKLSE